MDNLNYKTQAYARIWKENGLELELKEKMTPIEVISWLKMWGWKPYRKSGEMYQDDILKDNYHNIVVCKVLMHV